MPPPMPATLLCVGTIESFEQASDGQLDAADRTRIMAIRHPLARKRSRAAALLLAHALAWRFGGAPQDQRVVRDARGRPLHSRGASVSLSHSGDRVACSLSTAATGVGVDLQMTRTRHDTAAIAAQYFSEREAEWLSARPREAFFQLWVLKEAYLKALGLGLSGGLGRLTCVVEGGRISGSVDGEHPVALQLYRADAFYCALARLGGSSDEPACMQYVPDRGWAAAPLVCIATGEANRRSALPQAVPYRFSLSLSTSRFGSRRRSPSA